MMTLSEGDPGLVAPVDFDDLARRGDCISARALLAALAAADEHIAVQAEEAILVHLTNASATEPLIAALSSASPRVYVAACMALARIGTPAVPPLIKALRNPDEHIRAGAALVLGSLYDHRAVRPLLALLSDRTEAVRVRANAVEALGELKSEESVAVLLHALVDHAIEVRRRSAEALGAIGDGRAFWPLRRALYDRDSTVRLAAAEALDVLPQRAA